MRQIIFMSALPLALLLGCATDKKACPAKGLGVEAASGTSCGSLSISAADAKSCQEQIVNYNDYDCSQPQVCPDDGAHQIKEYVVGGPFPGQIVFFGLTNCSTGGARLKIEKVELAGDKRCAWKFDKNTDVKSDPNGVAVGEIASVRVLYKPDKPGRDHAHIRVFTNAQNFKPLVLPICAQAVAKAAPTGDGGVGRADGGTAKPPTTAWVCENVGTTIEKCHQ